MKPRQFEIHLPQLAKMVGDGMTNVEIAWCYGCHPDTVRYWMRHYAVRRAPADIAAIAQRMGELSRLRNAGALPTRGESVAAKVQRAAILKSQLTKHQGSRS